jgi:hypothetical protein
MLPSGSSEKIGQGNIFLFAALRKETFCPSKHCSGYSQKIVMKFDLTKISSTKTIAVLATIFFALNSSIWSQSSTGPSTSSVATAARVQTVAPPPAPERWHGLIGEYGTDKSILYILESDGKLCVSFARAEPLCLTELSTSAFKFSSDGQHSN